MVDGNLGIKMDECFPYEHLTCPLCVCELLFINIEKVYENKTVLHNPGIHTYLKQ